MSFIGLFDKREKELEEENNRLKDEISSLKKKLHIAETNIEQSKEYLELKSRLDKRIQLNNETREMLHNIELEKAKLERYIKRDTISIFTYNDEIKKRDEIIRTLEIKLSANFDVLPKTKVGRKSKINDSVIKRVRELNSENKSMMGIAEILKKESGITYSKSTVKKIIDNYIKDDNVCENK